MNPTIRATSGQEMLDALYELNQYALYPSPPFRDKDEWTGVIRPRQGITCHAAFEGDRPVSIAASSTMTQNMRGELFPASGIWGVSSHPAARRKGYVRQVMASLLEAERESGKVFTNLYPFRESFYERLGYISFPLTKVARFSPQALARVLKMNLEGEMELKLLNEGFEAYREFLSDLRMFRHGMGFFDYADQAHARRSQLWVAAARFDESIEGLMLYSLKGDEPTRYHLVANRFYYQTPRARWLMLDWIARHIDQADQVELRLSADEYPEFWLSDLQVKVESAPRSAMCRVLDVAKLGGMCVGEGSFTAHIIDPLCPWNQGVWRFENHRGSLAVTRTGESACEMTIQGLSALVAGTMDPDELTLRGWSEAGPAARQAQCDLFPRMIPFLHEMF